MISVAMQKSFMAPAPTHYNADYYAWQKTIGEFGGIANAFKFAPFIRPTDTVVDFGAGGGFLLNNLICARKIGVEIIPEARAQGSAFGLDMVSSFDEVPDGIADVIISNNALQHTDAPLTHLQDAYRKLKHGGLIVFAVGCESYSRAYVPGEVNFQFYSWSPLLLGNLFVRAGFDIVEVVPILHRWPQRYLQIQKLFGWRVFHFVAWTNGFLSRKVVAIRCVARKK